MRHCGPRSRFGASSRCLRRPAPVVHHLPMHRSIDLEAALDGEHAALLASLPAGLLDLTDLERCRLGFDAFAAAGPTPEMPAAVDVSEVHVPGFDGDPDVRLKLYRPRDLSPAAPALLWIHGGGMVLLSADDNDFPCAIRALEHGALVASVDYRLAPEAPAPAQIHDCVAAFRHLTDSADALGIDATRIVIAGASAGGGLAAGTALFLRDRGGPQPVAQLLVYPMLDHRNTTPSSHAIEDSRVWNREANLIAWHHYLGGESPTIYTSPAICDDLAGLPPAYITVGTLDMFLDEDVAYAVELNRAGVSCELHVFPGAFHLSQNLLPDHPTSCRWRNAEEAFVARALAGRV